MEATDGAILAISTLLHSCHAVASYQIILNEALDLLALTAVLYAHADAESFCGMRSLTVPPEEDETMQLDFTIVSLPGNAINLTNYISIDPMRVYFTAANWSSEVVLLVNGESEFRACLAIKSIAVPHACEAHAIEGGKERTCALVVPPSEQSCMRQM